MSDDEKDIAEDRLRHALGLSGTAAALATRDGSACVGQFSKFFAQGGGGTYRSDVAKDFAKNAHQPARVVRPSFEFQPEFKKR